MEELATRARESSQSSGLGWLEIKLHMRTSRRRLLHYTRVAARLLGLHGVDSRDAYEDGVKECLQQCGRLLAPSLGRRSAGASNGTCYIQKTLARRARLRRCRKEPDLRR